MNLSDLVLIVEGLTEFDYEENLAKLLQEKNLLIVEFE